MHVAIVGAGITGLTAAMRLHEQGVRVTDLVAEGGRVAGVETPIPAQESLF